ncbi:MAG: hypothetical protein FWG75_09060 [Cystobacterineae bacterium]|nr:hypothetical protein [Cystobacterineae bacterium]
MNFESVFGVIFFMFACALAVQCVTQMAGKLRLGQFKLLSLFIHVEEILVSKWRETLKEGFGWGLSTHKPASTYKPHCAQGR